MFIHGIVDADEVGVEAGVEAAVVLGLSLPPHAARMKTKLAAAAVLL
ncbi:hypothetical protein [Paraburkholderia sp. HD33-4]|nr:hypothetical protein [Paraburkholderia sp. HD33-4]